MWLGKLKAGEANLPPRVLQRRRTPIVAAPHTGEFSVDSGLLMTQYCQVITNKAVRRLGRPQLPVESTGGKLTLRCGSLFTGSASDAVAFDFVESSLHGEAVDVEFDWVFHCDIDPAKRSFADAVHAALKGVAPKDAKAGSNMARRCMPCSYGDVGALGDDEKRWCQTHIGRCRLPSKLDLLVAGFSCKDFSKANSSKVSKVLQNATSNGKTADTYHGMITVVDECMPGAIIIENVDDLGEDFNKDSLDLILSTFGERGYDTMSYILDAVDYALPQMKKRCFIVCILRPGRVFKINDSQGFFTSLQDLLEEFKSHGRPLQDVLRPVDDPCVVKDLERREKKSSKGWDSDTLVAHRKAWLTHLGVRMFAKEVGDSDQDSPWFATLTPREQDVLAFHQASCGKDSMGVVERPSRYLRR
jgi:site-specific DNA-cytosine methylase